jgi:hypothetical protein
MEDVTGMVDMWVLAPRRINRIFANKIIWSAILFDKFVCKLKVTRYNLFRHRLEINSVAVVFNKQFSPKRRYFLIPQVSRLKETVISTAQVTFLLSNN